MSKPATERKIGGEYGDMRAAIDLQKLNAYLQARVPEVTAPVTVKQFEVCTKPCLIHNRFLTVVSGPVWSGTPRKPVPSQTPDA